MRLDKSVVLAAAAVAVFGILSSGQAGVAAQARATPAISATTSAPAPHILALGNDPWD
jgi:hypothetical protein